MKLELKNISIGSVVFSAYPLVVFVISLINSVFAISGLDDLGLAKAVMQVILWAVASTLTWVVISLMAVFVYNLMCSLGIKGLRVEIEEVGLGNEEKIINSEE